MGDNRNSEFLMELERLINRYSQERHSNTPDFILTIFISQCLNAYGMTVRARDKFYGFEPGKDGG